MILMQSGMTVLRAVNKLSLQSKMYLIAPLLGICAIHSSAIAIDCEEWFQKLNLKRGSVGCEAACTKAADAMPVHDCSMYCRGMCVPGKDGAVCKLEPFWVKRLKASPGPFQTISGDEQESVKSALSKLPKSFQPTLLKAIVKGTRPHFTAPSSEAASTDEFIILYPRAFSEFSNLERVIAHEAVHVLILKEWADSFKKYKETSGWSGVDGNGYRKGKFVEYDGKSSPEEDFANNVEYFLFDQVALKDKSPDILSWLQTNLGQMLHMEKGCLHGK